MREVIRRALIAAALGSAVTFGGLAWHADQGVKKASAMVKVNAQRAEVTMKECVRSEPRDCSMVDYWFRNVGDYMADATKHEQARNLYRGLAWQVPLALALLWLVGTWIATGRLRRQPT